VIRWTALLLPVAGLLVFDLVAFDMDAVKTFLLVAGCALVVSFAALSRTGTPCLTWTNVSLALWIFVVARGLAVAMAPGAGAAFQAWLLLVALVAWHHLAAAQIPRAFLERHVPRVLAVLAVLLALVGILQWERVTLTFANQNFAGAALAMLVPFVLRVRGRWFMLPVVVCALVLTSSRGGLLAAAFAACLYAVWSAPRIVRLATLVAVPALVLVVGLQFGEQNTVKVRLAYYEAALKLGREHPVAGLGADGFVREYPAVRPLEELQISGGRPVNAVHNDYLESWADGGLIGILAHLFLLVAAARAARAHRAAAASLLAFAVAGLVDLPFREPSLWGLVFLNLLLIGKPVRTVHAPRAALFGVGALLIAASVPTFRHWRASRTFGHYLAERNPELLDDTLAWETDHPEALLYRGKREDLERLIALWPHNTDALFDLGRDIEDKDAALDYYRRLATDYNHVRARVRIAQLVMETDPLQAVSVLTRAIEISDRDYLPYVYLARIRRENGQLDEAEKTLSDAFDRLKRRETRDTRQGAATIRKERFELAVAQLRNPRWSRDKIRTSMRHVPTSTVRARIEAALERARTRKDSMPPPEVPPREGESPTAYALRIDRAKEAHRALVARATRSDYLEALVLSELLLERHIDGELHRLAAKAAHGLGEHAGGHRHRAWASLVKGLVALERGEDEVAERRFRSAFLDNEEAARDARTAALLTRFFQGKRALLERESRALRYLRAFPELAEALRGS
jgi:O-antigen ligase